MSLGRSLLRNKSLLRVTAQEKPPETLISFHSSGLTCNQWRKLKNLWFPGRTLFRPSCFGENKNQFLEHFGRSAGPTCISYFPEGAASSEKLESMDQDLLLLYGQYGSTTLVDHVDVEKDANLVGSETSLFDFYLPSSYLGFLCSGEELNPNPPPT